MKELMQHVIDVWVGVEQSVIVDAVHQWRRRLHACLRAKGHFECSTVKQIKQNV